MYDTLEIVENPATHAALGMAREAGVPMQVVAAVAELLTAARGCGYAESDIVAVADVLRMLSSAATAARTMQ